MMNVGRGVLGKAMKVSLVVGTAIALINHGDVLVVGYVTLTRLVQIVLCYAVPFGVSLYSQLTAVQHKPNEPGMPSMDKISRG